MKVTYRSSFLRDLKRIRDRETFDRIRAVVELVETIPAVADIPGLKKIAGAENHWRIRVGEYRLGVVITGSTVDFVRCLHRRDIYRRFP